MSFTATVNKGFHMAFENGVEISVQWGYGNFCNNKDLSRGYLDTMETSTFGSRTAEILITTGNDILTPKFAEIIGAYCDGHVIGDLTADQVAEAISWAKNY